MEFNEKLQELRKQKGITQEELAEALYVSRTAVSKWDSGRGYPSIDSLKMISTYFSVTIDDLLSGEKLIFIAEKENKTNIQNICEILVGIVDVLSVLLIILPLYPKTLDGYVYSVNLWEYTETAIYNRIIYWILFITLVVIGIWQIFQIRLKIEKGKNTITLLSLILSIITVLYLVLAREAYASMVVFLLMIIKGIVIFKGVK